MTAQTWIDETKNLLLTDYVEECDTLGTGLNTTETTVNFTHDTAGIVAGTIIEIGTELMYVFSVNATTMLLFGVAFVAQLLLLIPQVTWLLLTLSSLHSLY